MFIYDASLPINDEGHRDPSIGYEFSRDTATVQVNRKFKPFLGYEFLYKGFVFEGTVDEGDIFFFHDFIQALNIRQFGRAGRTPGCPKVEEYNFPPKLCEIDLNAIQPAKLPLVVCAGLCLNA